MLLPLLLNIPGMFDAPAPAVPVAPFSARDAVTFAYSAGAAISTRFSALAGVTFAFSAHQVTEVEP